MLLTAGCSGSGVHRTENFEDPFATACSGAISAMRSGDLTAARISVKTALQLQPANPVALELAGDIEGLIGNHRQANSFFSSAVDESRHPSIELLDKLGRSHMNSGRPFDAASTLEKAVLLYPENRNLRTDLAGLLASLGRELEALPHLQWLIMRGFGSLNELSMVSDPTRSQVDENLCRYAIQHDGNDLRPHFALAREKDFRRDWTGVARELQRVVAKHPDFAVAQAYYGRALSETDEQPTVETWAETLPDSIQVEPQYWMALGVLAERREQTTAAARSFWQACLINPNDAESLSRLAHSLAELGMPEEAKACALRAGQISLLREQVDTLYARGGDSQITVVKIAKTLQSLGRLWEAAAWLRVGVNMPKEKDSSLAKLYLDIRAKITTKTPWQFVDQDVAKQLDFSDWPVPDWQLSIDVQDQERDDAMESITAIHFVDAAAEVGLYHVCKIKNPVDPESGVWIYQTGAGGAAAIDYDLDGWPDVCLSAMDGTPLQSDSSPNRLYRNLSGKFLDVTEASKVRDHGFTQGISVSDINMDGFDDIYFANIGRNRVYLNGGDGTFSDATDQFGLEGENWTSSATFVDLDQDGLVDLFEVGYIDINETLKTPCVLEGKTNPCRPTSFSAQQDRVWQGQSDGRLVERTAEWLTEQNAGRGFGIVTGFLDDQPGIDVYVANDMSANHFWSSNPRQGESFQLFDQAYIRGLAVDRRSQSQASMGVAAGDPDRDGDVDLYVTHFEGEYNTYYEQAAPGIWTDVSESNGHAVPTTPMLGFGAQFLDADNDGALELVVANGHVNNFESEGAAYRMPSQLMRRSGSGQWTVQEPRQTNDFFATKHISRCLINLDFNRDGRIDCIMTHIFDPISLLVNKTETSNQSLSIFLKGTRCHVDAIGAMVSMNIEGKPASMQLIGGGGFQCSNQRYLHFGLGKADGAEQVMVAWPSGAKESFGSIRGNGEWLLIEGDGLPVDLRIAKE